MRPCQLPGLAVSILVLVFALRGFGILPPAATRLENFDKRVGTTNVAASAIQTIAVEHLQSLVPGVRVDFDPIIGSPKFISAREGFLSGPNGAGRAVSSLAGQAFAGDPYGPTKAFVSELVGGGVPAVPLSRSVTVKVLLTMPNTNLSKSKPSSRAPI